MPGSGVVRRDLIELPQLQGGAVLLVLNTNHELRFYMDHICQSRIRLILCSLAPIPWASYQWMSARHIVPSESRMRASPFRFLHRPGPYVLRKRLHSRILAPVAGHGFSRAVKGIWDEGFSPDPPLPWLKPFVNAPIFAGLKPGTSTASHAAVTCVLADTRPGTVSTEMRRRLLCL